MNRANKAKKAINKYSKRFRGKSIYEPSHISRMMSPNFDISSEIKTELESRPDMVKRYHYRTPISRTLSSESFDSPNDIPQTIDAIFMPVDKSMCDIVEVFHKIESEATND